MGFNGGWLQRLTTECGESIHESQTKMFPVGLVPMIEIRTLEQLSFDELVVSFLKAFDGYFVKMPDDPEYYRNRWLASGLRYDLSFGAFRNNQLVGFVLHCIDHREGHLIAFNTGTGVIPEFRGQRLISKIYSYALPVLVAAGVTKSKLEVIQQNYTAINIYKRVGFKTTRDYKCFKGELTTPSPPALLKEVEIGDLNWDEIPNQSLQSWDNQRHSLVNGPYKCYKAISEGNLVGYVAINLQFNYVGLCEITTGIQDHWDQLLAAIKQKTPLVRISNVDSSLSNKIAALSRVGLENAIDQYEMELSL